MFDERSKHLRWFILPSEAKSWLSNPKQAVTTSSPFNPIQYPRADPHTRQFNDIYTTHGSSIGKSDIQGSSIGKSETEDSYIDGLSCQLNRGFDGCDEATTVISCKGLMVRNCSKPFQCFCV